jgi:predicted ArsR family transcriptional regulator
MDDVTAIGVLADPVRRRLYEYVAGQADAVSREQAAEGADVPLHSARFHLDRLVDEGLLSVEHRRLSGRTGPGAGRPAKVYRRADREVAVSFPPRAYDLVGRVLAAAVARSLAGAALPEAISAAARESGAALGTASTARGAELERTAEVLAAQGFEPTRAGSTLELRNCPFDTLAKEHPALVCGLNHDFVAGVVEGLGCRRTTACLDPGPDRCCVRVQTSLA